MSILEELKVKLKKYNQEHLLNFWDDLDEKQKNILINDINHIDFEDVCNTFYEVLNKNQFNDYNKDKLEPLCDKVYHSVLDLKENGIVHLTNLGLDAIRNGKVAVILLSGGQGTRLGVSYPKGMYNVNLPSKKTLIQLQAERFRKLKKLASVENDEKISIPWYIMTSESTKNILKQYFEENNYFNLDKNDLVFFEQNKLPCFTLEGKIILKSKYEISFAPDGNGGLYKALENQFILKDMKKRNIEYVHVYCVDNILVKIADPIFIGHCIKQKVEAGAKSVKKNHPDEPVGVFSKVNDKYKVVEYSELSKELAELKKPDGSFVYNCGNICNHFFTIDLLQKIKDKKLPYHVAKKKIEYIDLDGIIKEPTKPNGIKLEKFIFDVFEFTKSFTVLEVIRSYEFSPLKNNDSEKEDTPSTAKLAIYNLHRNYIKNAGGSFAESEKNEDDFICEISPLLSYAGEDLKSLVEGKTLRSPIILYANEENKINKLDFI